MLCRQAAGLALACSLFLLGGAQAQQQQRHPLATLPPAAPGLESQFWVPERPGLNFPAGEAVEVVVGLHNGAVDTFNVSAIFGSLNDVARFSTHFFNFSGQGYGQQLAPGEEASLSYTLYLPPQLPPREFQIALTVFYNSPTEGFSTTFFNKTVDIIEPPSYVDTQLLFLWVLLLLGLAAVGYVGYVYVQDLPFMRRAQIKRAKQTKRTRAAQPMREANPDEWLKGTNFAKGGKAQPRRKPSQKDLQKTAASANGQLSS